MRRSIVFFAALIAASFAGCAAPSTTVTAGEPNGPCDRPQIDDEWIAPVAAVQLVAGNPDHCQPGAFVMTVRASGRSEGVLYLNSEDDYRNAKNLSIAILPEAQRQIAERLHEIDVPSLEGQDILVVGVARRRTVHHEIGAGLRARNDLGWFMPDTDGALNLSYHQTHVLVESAAQIWLLRSRVAGK